MQVWVKGIKYSSLYYRTLKEDVVTERIGYLYLERNSPATLRYTFKWHDGHVSICNLKAGNLEIVREWECERMDSNPQLADLIESYMEI